MLYLCFMNESFILNWKSQVKKGTLTFIILNVLRKQECYGYELIEQIKEYTDIEIAEGTLYPLLNRLKTDELVDSKWVAQDSGIPRKYYCLTDSGVASLEEMNTYWKKLSLSIQKIVK